jgi:hypothetical protein
VSCRRAQTTVVASQRDVPADKEARALLHSTIGAHRASPIPSHPAPIGVDRGRSHRSSRARLVLGLALAGSVVASLAVAPAVGATTTTSRTATHAAAALTTTAVDRPWYTTERFYLGLLNCTRTGGWVLSNGTCRGYGSGSYSARVAPITYSFGLSDKVSRPYARLLALKAICTHSADGGPGDRLRAVGYTRWTWGENIGCRDGYATAKAAVLQSHLNFQAERSSNGGHWKTIKNPKYKWVGIGIWRSGTRTRLVTNFYG